MLPSPSNSPHLCQDAQKSEPASPPCQAPIYSKPRLLSGQQGNVAARACLCRGHSPIKVERPFKGHTQIAKTTLVCTAFIILGCGGLGPFSPQTEIRKHVNNFVWSHSCTDPQSLLAWTVQEPLELSCLASGIPVRWTLASSSTLKKPQLSWNRRTGGKRDNNFKLPVKLQLLAHPGKGRYDTVCDTEPGLSTSTGIKPRHQYCFKTQSIFGHSVHTS